MNNELDSITSTKEYKINQYNILILLVKFACITMGFYGGIMGIWTVVAGEWNERCMLKTPIEEDKNDNITSASDKMIIHEETKLSRVEVHDNYEENKQSTRNRKSTAKNKLRTSTTLVFCIIFVILSVCESKKGPLEEKYIVGYCTRGDKNCHDIHSFGIDLTVCNSSGYCDLSTLPNDPTCQLPKPGKSLDFEFGDGKTFCQDTGKIPFCTIHVQRRIFPINWKLIFVSDARNRFKLERTSDFLTENGIKFKTFSFDSTLVFEKNDDGSCKRSMIISAMPTDEMNVHYKEYNSKVSEMIASFRFLRAVSIVIVIMFLCG